MELTQPADWVGKSFNSYVMNTGFSEENQQLLGDLIRDICRPFADAVFIPPGESLHITLLDWIAPLVDYGQDKDELFDSIRPAYDAAIAEIVSKIGPITVHFTEIHASPSTIFVLGRDSGEFQAIREQFLSKVSLPPGTKLPPKVVHSSLARFTKQIDLAQVNRSVGSRAIDLRQRVSDFRLTHVTREPLLEFEVVKRYKLVGGA